MNLFKFELIKYKKNTKNMVLIILTIIFTVVFCVKENKNISIQREEAVADAEVLAGQLMSDQDEYIKNSPELMPYFDDAINSINEKFINATPDDWKLSLKADNKLMDNIKTIQKKTTLNYLSKKDFQNKQKNNYFLTHNIKPDNELYGLSALYFVKKISSILFSLYGYLLFLLLFYDLFSREIERKNKQFLVTLPVSYSRFIKSKLFLSIILTFLLILFLCMVSFIYGIVVSEAVGSISYPIAFQVSNNAIEPFPFLVYFSNSLFVFLLMNYLVVLLLVWISEIGIESEKILLSFAILITSISEIIKALKFYPSHFLFLNYIDLHTTTITIFTRKLLLNYIESLVFLSLLLIIVTYYSFRNEFKQKNNLKR